MVVAGSAVLAVSGTPAPASLAVLAAERVTAAAAAYAELLDRFEDELRTVTARLAASTEPLGLLDDIDAHAEPMAPSPVAVPRPPTDTARRFLSALAEKVSGLGTPTPAQHARRTIRSVRNGLELTVLAQAAAALVDPGDAEYVDGLGDHRLDYPPTTDPAPTPAA